MGERTRVTGDSACVGNRILTSSCADTVVLEMYKYSQITHKLSCNGAVLGFGYSGTGTGRDNPAMERVANVGPIPRGTYRVGPAYDDPHLGPCAMHLDPQPGTNTFGRSLFRIHGSNATNDASHGCIILEPQIRHAIRDGNDKEPTVVA
jgi:hypothetical protein